MSPIWLARIADLAFVFGEVSPYLEMDVSSVVKDTMQLIAESQLPHGGVPNCVGPWMSGWQTWERLVCCTRWNAYVFRLFCSKALEKPSLEKKEMQPCEWGDSFVQVREWQNEVRLFLQQEKKLFGVSQQWVKY
jgi:hypothetical protein